MVDKVVERKFRAYKMSFHELVDSDTIILSIRNIATLYLFLINYN